MDEATTAEDGIDRSIIEWLAAEGYHEKYSSNKWVGRIGP